MATKFGYVERNLENDVNWAEVGKGFSDLLLAERDERKAKKKNLDDVMYSAQESFRKEAPIGYNTTFNDQTMSLVAQSTAIVKAWNTDMKAGNISPEEYMRKMQSMNDSVDTFFALGNNYNKFYENKLNRMDKGISGNVEGASFQAITDLLDFNKMGITFDVDGHIIAAPLVKGKDGVTSMDTDNARSIQAVFNLAQNDVDTIDVLSTIQDKVKLMGTDIVGTDVAATYGKEGMKKVLTGLKLTDPDTYNEYKATALNSMLVNDFHVAAILSDFTDKYETTTDRKKWEANKDKYLLVDIEDGKEVIMGEFTEKQREDARDILDKAWEGQVGTSSVETATSEKTWSPRELETFQRMRGNTEAKKTLSTYWNQLGWGTAAQKQKAIEALVSNPNLIEGDDPILGIEPNDDGTELYIIYDGGRRSRPIDLTQNYTPQEWASLGAEVHGEPNVKKAVAAGGGWKKDVTFTTATAGDSKFKVKGVIRQGVTTDRATQEDKVTTVENFSQAIKNTIVKNKGQEIADAIGAAGGNAKYNDGKVTIGATDNSGGVTFDITTDDGVNSVRKWIRGFIKNDYDQMKIFSSGGTGGSGGVAR
jgi:hypothetical protein